jgi:hypothetical protein
LSRPVAPIAAHAHNRARFLDTYYYLRFFQRDPMGMSGGSYASLYAYIANSPMNGTDPTGMYMVIGFSNAPSLAWQEALANLKGIYVGVTSGGGGGGGGSNGNAGGSQTATGDSSYDYTCIVYGRFSEANPKLMNANPGGFGQVEQSGDAAVYAQQWGFATSRALKSALGGESISGTAYGTGGTANFIVNDQIDRGGATILEGRYPGAALFDIYGGGDRGTGIAVLNSPFWVGCPVGTVGTILPSIFTSP